MTEPIRSAGTTAETQRHRWWRATIVTSNPRRRRQLAALTLALVAIIGGADFLLGFELSMQVFYIVPVCLAVASVGWRFGIAIAFASVASGLIGDAAAGAHYLDPLVPWANAFFALGTYFAVVALFQIVLTLQREMEERVAQRTAALQSLIAERERLEKALLEAGERERRSIGQDLHDGLGQHLTGVAFTGQVLAEKLQSRHLPEEEADLRRIMDLIEEAVEKTRRIARGLLLAEVQPDTLTAALQELAASVSTEFRVSCDFRPPDAVHIADTAAATHLFHIVQEAAHNAIRHGKAKRITIELAATPQGSTLSVADDGTGLPPPAARGNGLGLQIMAHRAEIIGWQFSIGPRAGGGAVVTCRGPGLPPHHDRQTVA